MAASDDGQRKKTTRGNVMWKAEVITSRDNGGVLLRALLANGDSISDTTNYPAPGTPDPNTVVWLFDGDGATLTAIESNADHYVLWAEEVVYE